MKVSYNEYTFDYLYLSRLKLFKCYSNLLLYIDYNCMFILLCLVLIWKKQSEWLHCILLAYITAVLISVSKQLFINE